MIRDPFTHDMFAPPVIERPARIHAGMVFDYGGRLLKVHRVYPGDDPATPIIVEELSTFGTTLAGFIAMPILAWLFPGF